MRTFNWTIRLFLIHCFFILLVAEGSFFKGLDLGLSVFYLFVLWQAGIMIYSEFEERPWINLILIGVLSQLPGYIMTGLNLLYYHGMQGIAPDYIYGFQIWHTPLLPFISIYTFPVIDGFISYFVALFFLSPFYLMVMIMSLIARRMRVKNVKKYG